MKNNIDIIEGSGGSPPEPYVPVEDPNTLQSKAVARIVEILCEGEIEGAYKDSIEKSMFFDNTEVKDEFDTWNFSGVGIDFKTGLPDQDYIPGFPSVENEVAVNTEIVKEVGPVVKTISDTNTDDVRILVAVPRLTKSTDEGDLKGSSVKISISVKPDGGLYQVVKYIIITGKCISLYQRSYLIQNISQYGEGPWEVKLTRMTEDSGSVKISNKIYWSSYTSIINEKMIYPNTALIGLTVDSEQFGNKIPSRSYDIKGLKVKVPDNYTVATRTYTGEWTGTFKTEWCDNPAWVYYDLLTNSRYGMGLSEDKVDKWALYTVAQYCDTYIDDGYGSTEPRFVCNLVINVRKESIHVLNMLTSVFRGMPLWASGMATITQDRPKDPAKLVTNANVVGGLFSYEGSGIKERHTAAKVTWNDINDFCRKQVEYVENTEGISRYGWKSVDVYAYGATSRGQAHRVGKWILDSNLHETEIVHYKASFDQADLLPGDVIDLSDSHYNGGIEHRYSGRLVSSTSNTVTIDSPITIAGGKTYTLTVVLPDGSLDEDIEIINDTGEVTVLELAESFSTQPQNNAIWMVAVSDLAPRKFRVISNIEDEDNIFSITALYYDADKFARVEEGIYLDEIAESAIPIGAMLPPTSLAAEEFQYIEGGAHLYGCLLSWTHPDEPRKVYYDIQSRSAEDGIYIQQGETVNNSYDIRPVTSGTYDYRVRTVGAGGFSAWGYLTEFSIDADSTLCSGVENLQVYDGGTTFSGGDCEIEWDDSDCHLLKDYKVEVSKTDDTLLRTEYVIPSNYNYTHQMNTLDTAGSPIREIKFKVYVQNIYDKAGPSETLVAENPIPTMAGLTPTLTQRYGGVTIDWSDITPADNDMWKYKIYGNSSSPPTTIVHQCDAETTFFHWFGLDVGTMYYIQIEPYDYFGAGVKSDIVGEEPVVIPGGNVDVDVELVTSISMSDSDDNSAATLGKLYDRNKISEGVSYTVSGTNKYVQYKYAVEDLFDRVILYTADANAHAFIAYSSNGTDWEYLSGEADHTLDGDELVTASGISEAETNYWQLSSGTNVAIYPAMITGSYMRLYLTGNYTTTIYEIVFYREVVAEMVVTDTLSALSANCGTLTAGIIQSATYGADKGILVDLDNDRMILGGSSDPVMDIDADAGTGTFKGVFTFESGTDGYAEITDKPTDLGDINATEGTKLTGIADGADVTASGTALGVVGQGDLATQDRTDLDYTDGADVTSANTSADAAAYTGASIATTYTAAKATDPNADQTSANTSADTSAVNGLASSSVSGWAHTSDTTKINGGDIYTNTITASQIAATTITASQIASNTITAGQIAASAITASEVGANEIIANTANIKNAVITGAKIGNAEVDTLQIAGNAVTIPVSAYSSSSNSFSGENILSASITSTGGPIHVVGSLYCISVDSGAYFTMQLRRGSTVLMNAVKDRGDNGRVVCCLTAATTPGAGTYTFYIYVSVSSGTAVAYGRSLLLLEAKK